MIADLIVWAAVVMTLAYVAVWALKPGLRARIEQPKFEFQDALQAYERGRAGASAAAGDERRD